MHCKESPPKFDKSLIYNYNCFVYELLFVGLSMQEPQKLIQAFEQLAHEQKLQKLQEVLAFVDEQVPYAHNMGSYLASSDVSDEFLVNNYAIIVKTAYVSKDNALQKSFMDQLHTMQAIHEREVQQDAQEKSDADTLLQSI